MSSLFPLTRQGHPETSKKGADFIRSKLADLHERVGRIVHDYPGMTASELAMTVSDRDPRTIGRRLPELARAGLIRRGEARRCSVTGRPATTWWPA